MTDTVVVAMPVYDKVHPQAWMGHMRMMGRLGRILPEGDWGIATVSGLPQPHAQNMLIRECLHLHIPSTDARPDWILWVEADAVPPDDAWEKLREQADPVVRPVVHGLSANRESPFQPSAWVFTRDSNGNVDGMRPLDEWQPNRLYKIDHSGTCLSLFHSSVFAKLTEPWFRMQPFFQGDDGGMMCCLSLSARMVAADIPIYCYTGCLVPHVGAAPLVRPEKVKDWRAKKGMANIPIPISHYAKEFAAEVNRHV